MARDQSAALFVTIHADSLPRKEGDAQGATIYTLSDKASDVEAARLAEMENKADAIGGLNLKEEPTDVADILIDLAQRENPHIFKPVRPPARKQHEKHRPGCISIR